MTTRASLFIPSTSTLIDDDTAARVALACAGLSGNLSITIGIEAVGGATELVAAVHDGRDRAIPLSVASRKRIREKATAARVARVLERTTRCGLQVLTPRCELWPTQLEVLRHSVPLVLWTKGDPALLETPSIAITGPSAPSGEGIHMAIELGTGLADRGWTIIAGSSAGIDQLAVRAAEAMRGRSLVVTSAPLDTVTVPAGHSAVVSEVPPMSPVSVEAQRRSKHLLGGLAAKTIVIDPAHATAAIRTGEAAQGFGRPVGTVTVTDSGPGQTSALLEATPIETIRDAVRLH